MSDTKRSLSRSEQRARNWRNSNARRTGGVHFGQAVTKTSMNGGKIRVPPNPPDVKYQPWMRINLVHSFKSSTSLAAQDILQIIKKQIDPTKRGFNQETAGDERFVLQMKFNSFRIWNLTGRSVSLSVEDFTDSKNAAGGREQLCGLVDIGTQIHTPAVGYLLPASHRNHVIRTDDITGSDIIVNCTAGDNDTCVLYIDLSFRFDGPVVAPKLLLPDDILINGTETSNTLAYTQANILSNMHSAVQELKIIAENTEKEKPSVVRKIVDGVEEIALLVTNLAGVSSASSFARLDQAELE